MINKFIQDKKKFTINILITFIALIILLALTHNFTNTTHDWIMIGVVSVLFAFILFILDLFPFFKMYIHLQTFLFAFILYMWFYTISYFLIVPMSPFISICAVIGGYIGTYTRRKTTHTVFTFKKFAALTLALIIMYSSLFYLLDDSLLGTTKVERDVKKYLIQEKHYKRSDIKDTYCHQKKGSPILVTVRFKDEINTEYVYKVNGKEIVQVGTTSYDPDKPTHKHIENENVNILR